MKREILNPLRGGGRVFYKGDERRLAEADLPEESLRALQEGGYITGFVSEKDGSDDDKQTPVRELREFLSDKSEDEVIDLAAADHRSSARPYYEARLNELKKE
jgi:hypothetical protein